jgi:uncharacterized protein (TIGR03083 family)
MQLAPHYGPDPIIVLDGDPSAIAVPVIRQRRRLAAALATFDDEQWAHPSRCEGWSNRDVIVHLTGTNSFWALSIAAGLRGEPTRFLATFDPVASPARMVATAAPASNAEVLAQFVATSDALADQLGSLSADQWALPAEAPPGHISVSAVAHHALWDSWIHERDILLPLGLAAEEEADEVAACLRYVAGLGPCLAASRGRVGRAVLAIEASGPHDATLSVRVDVSDRVIVRDGNAAVAVGDLMLVGDAVQLVEALSVRAPLQQPIPPEVAWLVSGLLETFDVLPG